MDRLVSLLAAGVFFGDEEGAIDLWVRAIQIVDRREKALAGQAGWVDLQAYPTVFAALAIGLAGIAKGNLEAFLRLATTKDRTDLGPEQPLLGRLVAGSGFGAALQALALNSDGRRFFTPASDWMLEALRKPLHPYFISDEDFKNAFHALEFAISVLRAAASMSIPPCRYQWELGRFGASAPDSFNDLRPQLHLSGLFDDEAALEAAIERVIELARQNPMF